MTILQDDGQVDPNYSANIWTEVCPATLVFTGDSNWGYDFYYADLPCSSPCALQADQLYWLSLKFHDDSVYDY